MQLVTFFSRRCVRASLPLFPLNRTQRSARCFYPHVLSSHGSSHRFFPSRSIPRKHTLPPNLTRTRAHVFPLPHARHRRRPPQEPSRYPTPSPTQDVTPAPALASAKNHSPQRERRARRARRTMARRDWDWTSARVRWLTWRSLGNCSRSYVSLSLLMPLYSFDLLVWSGRRSGGGEIESGRGRCADGPPPLSSAFFGSPLHYPTGLPRLFHLLQPPPFPLPHVPSLRTPIKRARPCGALPKQDDDDKHEFSKTLAFDYISQADTTFEEIEEALYVTRHRFFHVRPHPLGSPARRVTSAPIGISDAPPPPCPPTDPCFVLLRAFLLFSSPTCTPSASFLRFRSSPSSPVPASPPHRYNASLQHSNASDLDSLSRKGHFLKGSSAALGLQRVQHSCEAMQHFGNRRDARGEGPVLEEDEALRRCRVLLGRLRKEQEEAKDWLEAFYKA